MTPDLVFFYGSLMRAFARTRSLRVERDLAFVGAGWVAGALYEVGIYPALVPDHSARVVGEVHQMSHPGRVLQVLDEYEGCRLESPETSLYLRRVPPVTLASGVATRPRCARGTRPLSRHRGRYVESRRDRRARG